jgi:hypothetical protein
MVPGLSVSHCLLVAVAIVSVGLSSSTGKQCPERRPRSIVDRCRAFRTRQLPTGGGDGPSDDWVLRDPVPPSLISQAGAGNTMVRLLLDYATGLHSGASDGYGSPTLISPLGTLNASSSMHGRSAFRSPRRRSLPISNDFFLCPPPPPSNTGELV